MTSSSAQLFATIEAGDAQRVRTILAAEPLLAVARDAEGVSALMRARYRSDRALTDVVGEHVERMDVFEAAAFGELDRVDELLAADPTLNERFSEDGFTALHLAAFFAPPETTRLLVDRGADVNARGRGWMTGTPLNSAAGAGHTEAARILLQAGAEPDARQSQGWTPLHAAARTGNEELARLLLLAGADPDARDDEGRSVLDLAREGTDAGTIAVVEAALAH